MALIWTTLAVALVLYIFQGLLNLKNKKKLPPGPRGLPIIGHLHLIGTKNPSLDFYNLAKKYGPFMHMQLGFENTFVASSPEAIEKILKTYDHILASRPDMEVARVIYENRSVALSKYGSYWRYMRKLITSHLLTSKKINSYQSSRKAEVSLLIKSIQKAAREGVAFDLSGNVTTMNANLTCLMLFGKKFNDDDLDERGFKAIIQDLVHLTITPNLGDYFPYFGLLDLQGITSSLKVLAKVFDGFFDKIIEENETQSKETENFVTTLLAIMKSGEAGFEFDRSHIKALLLDCLVAAMDTSATSVEWILTELVRHPQVMKKLQKELEEVVGLDRMVEESDLEKLKYLDMVIKEALRIHPPLHILIHKAMEDTVIDDYYVKKGSRMVINVYAAQRDPKAWPEPEKFLPERFVDSKVDYYGADFQFLPFGSGRRSCPGMHLGVLVVRMVVAQLMHCFDWTLPNGMEPKDLDMSEKFGLITCRAKHLMAIPTYRLNN